LSLLAPLEAYAAHLASSAHFFTITSYSAFTKYVFFWISEVIFSFPNFPHSGVSSNEIVQSNGDTTAGFFGGLTSNNCLTLSIPEASEDPATHPSWKVSSVS
jgi:hypothetical protein